jgi:anaerobic selenocysteine-containing dehydrogenase
LIPEIPEFLQEAAEKDRMTFGLALMKFIQEEPSGLKTAPFVLAKTLGRNLDSANLAALWGLLQTVPQGFREDAKRAGFTPGPMMGEEIFKSLLDHPEGIWIGRCDPEKNLEVLRTEDGKINIEYPEMRDWIAGITPEAESRALDQNGQWPFVLLAGRHMDYNANTLMRDPSWNQGKRACTLAMHPDDARSHGFEDGQIVRAVTEAGEETIELQVTGATRRGMVIIPHGFGLEYDGKVYGANVNRLTKNTHRDQFAATPLHRYVPCRVEAV